MSVFKPLFSVRLRHSFYDRGCSEQDLVVMPSPTTSRFFNDHGLLFRQQAAGWALYCEIEPNSNPPRLLKTLADNPLRLTFLLRAVNSRLANISELPEHRPGRSVFCLDNLAEEMLDGRLLLGDSVAGVRFGPAVRLVTGEIWTYGFSTAVNRATLSLVDRFGSTQYTTSFSLPDGTTTSEYRFDFSKAGLLAPGRYQLRDDGDLGDPQELYYDPEITAPRPFAVVEIFDRTDSLTPDGSNLVPDDYQFLNGNQLVGGKEYTVQFEARSTTWRYNVIKKYPTNGLDLTTLAITDPSITNPITFTRAVVADRAVFTSDGIVQLSEGRTALTLSGGTSGNRIRELPNPTMETPLGAVEGSPVSDLYVYV